MKTPGNFIEKILLWILTVFFAVFALIYFPTLRCIAAIITAALLAPIPQWQETLGKFAKGNIKTIITIILVILTFLNLPTPETNSPSIPLTTTVTVQNQAIEATPVTTNTTETTTAEPTIQPTAPPVTDPVTETTTVSTTAATTASTTVPPSEPPTAPPTEPPTEPATTVPPSESTAPPTTNPPTEPATESTTPPSEGTPQDYVLNKNSKKFHYPSCSSAKQIKDTNREDFYGTRDELLAMNYSPCGRCHP